MTVPRLETERLVLRALNADTDFEAYAKMVGDEETTRYLGGVMDRASAWRNLAFMLGHWDIRGFGMFAVEEKVSGDFVGRVGAWRPGGWPGDEVGWTIVRDRWGRGYAAEAAGAAMDWVFDELGWPSVIHVIHPDNENSKRVAEKLGSKKVRVEDNLAGLGWPGEVWEQSADDWRDRS